MARLNPGSACVGKKRRNVKNVRRTQTTVGYVIRCLNSNKKRLTSVPAEVMQSGHAPNGLVVRLKLPGKPCLFIKLHSAYSP